MQYIGEFSLGESSLDLVSFKQTIAGLGASHISNLGSADILRLIDLNEDGKKDLVSSNSGVLMVALSNGDGTFGSAVSLSASITGNQGQWHYNFEDINNDGKTDLVYASSSSFFSQLGNGDGTFGSATTLVTTTAVVTGIVGDMDGDGHLDLIYRNSGEGIISIQHGDGTGGFGAVVSVSLGGAAGFTATDLNGDDRPDLYYEFSSGTSIFYQTSGRNYSFNFLATGTSGSSTRFGDANGDGYDDAFRAASDGTLYYFRNNGNNTFATGVSIAPPAVNARIRSIGDFNGDGFGDLLSYDDTTDVGYVQLSNGNGTFQAATSFSNDSSVQIFSDFEVGDFNGDGRQDLLVGTFGGRYLRLGTSDGLSASAFSVGGVVNTNTQVAFIDIDGDGIDDIISGNNPVSIIPGSTAGLNTSFGKVELTFFDGRGDARSTYLDLSSATGAQAALATVSRLQERIELQRNNINISQKRLTSASAIEINRNGELTKAVERIRSADVADETTRLAKSRIFLKASTALLAQANLKPSVVLDLLK